MIPFDRIRYERYVATAREQLDETTFAAAWEEGRTMPLARAVTCALGETGERDR